MLASPFARLFASLALTLAVAGGPSLAVAQPAPTPGPTSVPLQAGARAIGPSSTGAIATAGGQFSASDGSIAVHAYPDPARPPITLVHQGADARTLPAAQSGLSLGFAAFQLAAVNSDTGAPVSRFSVPLDVIIKPGESDMALALGRLERLQVGTWNGDSWIAVPCSPDVATVTLLVCSTTQPGLFVPLVALPVNPLLDRLDFDVPSGHFYTQGNGFGGADGLGYAVVDDGDAAMWSEFLRQGGVGRLGYPVTNRFVYDGVITQAFQKGALLWLPDIGQSTPLNILDELHTYGSDSWLDAGRQVPPAPPDGQGADASILAQFPAILAAYEADPDFYGLPVSVADYGEVGSARFERSTMHVWAHDVPFAAAGTVVRGDAGDLARAAGLWPVEATTPGAAPSS
jgi:hypothetical protein